MKNIRVLAFAFLAYFLSWGGEADARLIFSSENPEWNGSEFVIDTTDEATSNVDLKFGNTATGRIRFDIANDNFEINKDVDFELNELKNARLENILSAPTCDVAATGRVYFNTSDNNPYVCTGTTWVSMVSAGGGGAVDSVNGQTGVVVLDTDDVDEGSTNLYFTDARADARIDAKAFFEAGSAGTSSVKQKGAGTTDATGNYSFAIGYNNISSGERSFSNGFNNTASGWGSHAEGSITQATGSYSHAEGSNTQAIGADSHAEGLFTIASGDGAHSEGKLTTASGEGAHSQGRETTATGNYSFASGYNSEAVSSYSFVHSRDSDVDGINTAILGGQSNTMNTGVSNSVILGGSSITGDTSNTVFVPKLSLETSLSTDNTNNEILVRDATGEIQKRAASTIINENDTDDLSEGSTNLYYTQGRFDTAFGAKDTDDLSEGGVNLYFTDERVDDRVSNLLQGGNLLTTQYSDAGNSLVVKGDGTEGFIPFFSSNGEFSESSNLNFTNNGQLGLNMSPVHSSYDFSLAGRNGDDPIIGFYKGANLSGFMRWEDDGKLSFSPLDNGSTFTVMDNQIGVGGYNDYRFTVATNGDITKIKNVSYSFPGTQGASGSVLTNDGGGTLSWSNPTVNKVSVSSNDTTDGYLQEKIIGTSNKITVTEVNNGGNEDLKINVGSDILDKTSSTTDDLSEGSTNLYYTQGRFDTAFGAKDTDDLSEGGVNLYFTDERVDDRVSNLLVEGEGIDLSYNDGANSLTLIAEDASDTNKGVASFATADFDVTSGAVSLEDSVVKTITTDSGTATAIGHDLDILGGNGVSTSASGSAITVDLDMDYGENVNTSGQALTGTPTAISGLGFSLGAGTYEFVFSGAADLGDDSQSNFGIYLDNVLENSTLRTVGVQTSGGGGLGGSAANSTSQFAVTISKILTLTGTTQIDVGGTQSAGSGTFERGTFSYKKLSN